VYGTKDNGGMGRYILDSDGYYENAAAGRIERPIGRSPSPKIHSSGLTAGRSLLADGYHSVEVPGPGE